MSKPVTPEAKPAPAPGTIPTSGQYLTLRRTHAGLSLQQLTDRMAALPWALGPVTADGLALLKDRLAAAELGTLPFTRPQVALLRQVFRFDVDVYCQLVDLDAAGAGCGLPVPQICTGCGCTWHDPCSISGRGCAWRDDDPTRCSACPPVAIAAEPELVS